MELKAIKQQLTINQVLQHYNLKPDKIKNWFAPFTMTKIPVYRFIQRQIPTVVLAALAKRALVTRYNL